jgi:mRNA-degrading endonuclease RelE of RelBE toxin-antitoxin system
MVTVYYDSVFEKTIRKINDQKIKTKVKKQIIKILENPEIGKPMKYNRKGTRELYIPPFRLSYYYDYETETIVFLTIYHKDKQ